MMATAMRWRATKRAMARAAIAMATATRVAGNKEDNDEGRKINGDGNKEGKGEGGKSNGGGKEEGKEEGNNMGDAYSHKGGGQATVATIVMATTLVMAMGMRWRATKWALARVARVMAMATRVKASNGGKNCNGDRNRAKDMAAHATTRSSAVTNTLDSVAVIIPIIQPGYSVIQAQSYLLLYY